MGLQRVGHDWATFTSPAAPSRGPGLVYCFTPTHEHSITLIGEPTKSLLRERNNECPNVVCPLLRVSDGTCPTDPPSQISDLLSIFGFLLFFFPFVDPFILSFSQHALHRLCRGWPWWWKHQDKWSSSCSQEMGSLRMLPTHPPSVCCVCEAHLGCITAEEEMLPTSVSIFPAKIYAGEAFFHY